MGYRSKSKIYFQDVMNSIMVKTVLMNVTVELEQPHVTQ